jgi:hypothetical protein
MLPLFYFLSGHLSELQVMLFLKTTFKKEVDDEDGTRKNNVCR